MAEHLTSEARASAYAEWHGILPDGYMQAPFDAGFDAGRASVLADRDAAVAALRLVRAIGPASSAYDIARAYLARLEPEKTDAG